MTDAQRDAMIADLDAFDTKFASFKCLLTPEQIKSLSKLRAADVGLLDLALAYAQQNPGGIPPNVGVAEMAKDSRWPSSS